VDTDSFEMSLRPADYVIELMKRAAAANEKDPLLHGRLIELPGEGEVMVTGDLHGNLPNFRRITRVADLGRHRGRHVILQEMLHSMYEDTPDRSYQLLEEVAIYKSVYPAQVHILVGNHEIAELYGLEILKRGRSVLRAFDAALEEAYQFNKDVVREAYYRFLRSLPWAAATPHGIFICHSLPDGRYVHLLDRQAIVQAGPGADMGRNTPVFRMAWGRDIARPTTKAFAERVGAELIICGHHPCQRGYTTPNPQLVVIDSKDAYGAYAILPLDRRLRQQDVVDRIKFLNF